MKSRFYHVRAPLMIRQFIGNKEVHPAVISDLAGNHGGCTILIEDHDAEYVKVRVAWCRWTDCYSRKIGRLVIQGGKLTKKKIVTDEKGDKLVVESIIAEYSAKEPNLVKREELAAELSAIEEQMLISCCWPVRHDEALLKDCLTDWSHAHRRFEKLEEEKVAVAS